MKFIADKYKASRNKVDLNYVFMMLITDLEVTVMGKVDP